MFPPSSSRLHPKRAHRARGADRGERVRQRSRLPLIAGAVVAALACSPSSTDSLPSGGGHGGGSASTGVAGAGATAGATGGTSVSTGGDGAAGKGGSNGVAGTGGSAGVAGGDAGTGGEGARGGSGGGGTSGRGGTAGSSTGGQSGVGGVAGTAGAIGSGGASGAAGRGGSAGGGRGGAGGGRGGSGGASAVTGPVLVSTIDLKDASGCPGLRIGDINGDGRMEIVVGQPVDQATLDSYTPQVVAAVTAFDLKGNVLWQYGKPNAFHTASSDIPIQVYDLDGDGKAEVFANMSRTEMTVLDGTTGQLVRKIPLPAAGANDSIAYTNLRGTTWPQDMIVKTRYGQFWAITGIDSSKGPAGTVLWNHRKGPDTGFSDLSTGHYPLVYDWNGDGKDELMGGYDFMDSTGKTLWSATTLELHADAIATADIDGNPANGKEIVICGDVAAAFDWKTGTRLWQDTHSTEVQQLGIGNYRPDIAGLEVVLLDRLRTQALGLKSNNILLDGRGNLIWKEDRPNNSGWLTVTENLNNWDGNGSDFIFSYRRGSGGGYLYDGSMKTVATFPYPGTNTEQNFAAHADLCGDEREEVIIYDENKAWIYSNGGCDLDAPPSKPSQPQQYHLYNWSIYTGWITPDQRFYTPGSKQ
jgi:hypothetical protein